MSRPAILHGPIPSVNPHARDRFSVRYRWSEGTIAMWDNRCTQHRVVADNLNAHRRMERVTVDGDRPV